MTVRFTQKTKVEAPRVRVFDLSLTVEHHLGSMAKSGERVISGVRSGVMKVGVEVSWAARHFGVTWKMTSRITELERPRRFVDEQIRGPFARFRHEHLFEEIDGGTRMTDNVEFAAPFGPLGRLAERMLLAGYIEKLIRERAAYLLSIARK